MTAVNTTLRSLQSAKMPERQPALIKMFTSKVDERYRPTLANAIFSPLAAHVSNVVFDFIDEAELELASMMHLTIGPASCGKGRTIDPAVKVITEDLRVEDIIAREKLMAWAKEYNSKSNNSAKPLRPEDAFIRMPMADFTNASFTQLLMDAERAGNCAIYNNLPEIELLNQLQTKRTSVDRIICMNFDQASYGQERATANGISGNAHMRWSFNVSTVPQTARYFFRNGLLKGVVGRLSVSEIVNDEDEDDETPKFHKYNDAFRKKLQPYLDRLKAADGKVRCVAIEKTMDELMKEVKVDAKLLDTYDDREVFREIGYRSIVIAMRKAYILYIASGYKWTREMDEFIRWSQRYCFSTSLHIWGDMMISKLADGIISNPFDQRISLRDEFMELPPVFTCDDVITLRENKGKTTSNVNMITKRWRDNKWIVKVGDQTFRKIVGNDQNATQTNTTTE